MNPSSPLRLGILGSGKGSNCQSLLEPFWHQELSYKPVLVLSDVADAGILKIAEAFQIPAHFIHAGVFKTRLSQEAEEAYVSLLQEAKVDFIALAGFMRVLKGPLLRAFPGRILNIHPSLLPKFPGLAAWQQAYDANEMETGCTVHLVDEGVDTGKILGQARVPVLSSDTSVTLHTRIQEAEHELYPRVVNEFARGINRDGSDGRDKVLRIS
ncbi:MAG: phosphoribosylglycinamide formyltransferase [Chthoniobacterales bacterium]|nr:phosphoribosylglycinamide formyltransferase [Chthoniobacterales bacterium]